ncbi:tRNA (Thr-GGU) A37 N-methylase [Nonomuraea thailandensis]|uniref:tRNA (Thr-GGU) A37 N-methylase n=1 Tax=Nonomuraea thailandensis TaxID=1188745 RepID=A0A9X2GPF2_9ACTN|nr:TrmO family methyltransferase [Nonomuraea thailandensis]MCP2358413.1 tRNA (Thr-GGU) A37 N-methylase [Nonomuraea thailandensis]
MEWGTAVQAITLEPVGSVVGGRAEAFDDDWNTEQAVIRNDGTCFEPDALAGLDAFSHLEVVFRFHFVDPASVTTSARHPRDNPEWPKAGIFAQRSKNRPNLLGVSRCRLLAVDGLDLHVRGLDAIDGSPVLDVKPCMAEFGPQGETVQPEWATELMRASYLIRPFSVSESSLTISRF